jgi:hypothetical protein
MPERIGIMCVEKLPRRKSDRFPSSARGQIYQFRLEGHLDTRWRDWFAGLSICHEGSETIISGPVGDQSALHGLLTKIRDLNLVLISLERVPQIRDAGDREENNGHE